MQGLIAGVVVAAILVLAAYRQTRERIVSPLGMWIAPLAFLIMTALLLYVDGMSHTLAVAAVACALLAGVPVGWFQGTHCTVRIDRAARRIAYKANPVGVAIILAALGLRFGIKVATGSLAAPHPLSGGTALLSTAALGLAVGMLVGLRVYLLRRFYDAPLQAA